VGEKGERLVIMETGREIVNGRRRGPGGGRGERVRTGNE